MGIEQALFGRLSLYIPHQQTTGNGTLLNTVAAGSRKIGKVLDGASRGNSIALRGLSPPVVPSHLTRRLRFQQTTDNTTDFGDIRPDKRDLARLVIMDFMLMHGNDWFFIPLEQPVRFEPSGESVGFERSVGSVCRVDSLVVHDVFGGATLVERADAAPGPPGQRWTMFSTSVEGQ